MINMSTSLYELSQLYTDIMDLDLEQEQLESALLSLNDSIEEKTENICKVMAQIQGEEEMLDTEIKRLTAKKKVLGARRSSLKEYLSQTLKTLEISTIKGKLFTIKFRKSSSLVIDNEDSIPTEFKENVTVTKIDKNAIKKAFKEGVVEGCHIEESQNIQIK